MFRATPTPGTSAGWKQRQDAAAARAASRQALVESPEYQARMRASAEAAEARRVHEALDRERRAWDDPVGSPAWLTRGGRLHPTRLAAIAAACAALGWTDDTDPTTPLPGAPLPFARIEGRWVLTQPNPEYRDLILSPGEVRAAADPADASPPRRRGRPPRTIDGAIVEEGA